MVSMPVTAGNSPQNRTPATCAIVGESAPPSITCIGYSTPTRPFLGQQPQVQIEEQSGEDQEAEQRRIPGRAGKVRGELAADETQRGTHC